jgi:hypothetical protein
MGNEENSSYAPGWNSIFLQEMLPVFMFGTCEFCLLWDKDPE